MLKRLPIYFHVDFFQNLKIFLHILLYARTKQTSFRSALLTPHKGNMLLGLLCGEPIVGDHWVSKPSSVYTRSAYYMNPEITSHWCCGGCLYTLSGWKTIKRHRTLSVFDKDTWKTKERDIKRLYFWEG